jgi:hypothetical protein
VVLNLAVLGGLSVDKLASSISCHKQRAAASSMTLAGVFARVDQQDNKVLSSKL